MKKTILLLCVLLAACHSAEVRDPMVRSVRRGDVVFSARRDESWMSKSQAHYTGFLVRIDYSSARTFTPGQRETMDFGMQDYFALVKGADTLRPIFCQRISDGNADRAAYTVAFNDSTGGGALLLDDPLFGLQRQVLKW